MILVESDILIAHLRGTDTARDWLVKARRREPLGVSVISTAELTGGMPAPNDEKYGSYSHPSPHTSSPIWWRAARGNSCVGTVAATAGSDSVITSSPATAD